MFSQIFQNLRRHFKILGVGIVTQAKFHDERQRKVDNSVALETWRSGFVQP
jgi:hypothetical protein